VLSVVQKPSRRGSVVPPNQSMLLLTLNQARLALKQVRSIRVFRSKYGHPLPAFYGEVVFIAEALAAMQTESGTPPRWSKI
jgi:hypothetical protein